MKKFFTFVLPDEPYKDTTKKNLVVNATYEGMRYLACRVNTQTNLVEGVVFAAEKSEDVDAKLKDYTEEGYTFITVDASSNPFEAAYLSGEYSHDLIEDPTFILPRGLGEWTYHYDDYTGGISQAFFGHDLKFVNGKFVAPRYRTHAITRESLFQSAVAQAKNIKKTLGENDYTAEDRKKLTEYADWLENLEETYHDVDHWKISFPTDIPRL